MLALGKEEAGATAATVEEVIKSLTAQGVRFSWQLENMDSSDWDRVDSLDLGLKLAIKATLRNGSSLKQEDEVVKEEAAAAAGGGATRMMENPLREKGNGANDGDPESGGHLSRMIPLNMFTLAKHELLYKPFRFIWPVDHERAFRLSAGASAGNSSEQEFVVSYIKEWVLLAALMLMCHLSFIRFATSHGTNGLGGMAGAEWFYHIYEVLGVIALFSAIGVIFFGVVIQINASAIGEINFDVFMACSSTVLSLFDALIVLMSWITAICVMTLPLLILKSKAAGAILCVAFSGIFLLLVYHGNLISIACSMGGLFSSKTRVSKGLRPHDYSEHSPAEVEKILVDTVVKRALALDKPGAMLEFLNKEAKAMDTFRDTLSGISPLGRQPLQQKRSPQRPTRFGVAMAMGE